MTVRVELPDDLVAEIDRVTDDREALVIAAVRSMLRRITWRPTADDVARINEFAEELNREAEDVLEYQFRR
jgi:metal-responsive CopG/Arc/MetJ family transcriptional regulator